MFLLDMLNQHTPLRSEYDLNILLSIDFVRLYNGLCDPSNYSAYIT